MRYINLHLHYITLHYISEMAKDTAIVTMEGE